MKGKEMKPCDKMIARMKDELGLVFADGEVIERTRASIPQIAYGAWSWSIYNEKTMEVVGSPHAVKDLLRARVLCMKKMHYDHIEIDASESDQAIVDKRRKEVMMRRNPPQTKGTER
jgi:hypothetical protein